MSIRNNEHSNSFHNYLAFIRHSWAKERAQMILVNSDGLKIPLIAITVFHISSAYTIEVIFAVKRVI